MSENSLQSQSHIDSIVRQEEEALERRSSSERLADAVGGFAGSLLFVVLHLVLLVAWLLINSGKIPSARPFDLYPFSLLGVIVAVEAVILSSFILMRQNRMMRRGERRDHLNLQVDLLAEKEITKLLQMVRAICGQMGLHNIVRTPLLSRSVRRWRIVCRGRKVSDRRRAKGRIGRAPICGGRMINVFRDALCVLRGGDHAQSAMYPIVQDEFDCV
jgi:uncharacterized membrane protein